MLDGADRWCRRWLCEGHGLCYLSAARVRDRSWGRAAGVVAVLEGVRRGDRASRDHRNGHHASGELRARAGAREQRHGTFARTALPEGDPARL